VTSSYDCSTEETRFEGLAHAQRAITEQQCIVFPTDTVYGIAADAFSPLAVRLLLAAKGRSRTMPPPVLIPRIQTMDGLAVDIGDDARKLAEKFWPGALTLILHSQPSLEWDLGETKGTVALRVPDDELALEILARTGPLAVSSANRSGQPAAQTASNAQEQLAESVEVYLDGGPRPAEAAAEAALPSTIVDCTGTRARVVRQGAIALEELRDVVPSILAFGQEVPVWEPGADSSLNQSSADAADAPATDDAGQGEAAETAPEESPVSEGTAPESPSAEALSAEVTDTEPPAEAAVEPVGSAVQPDHSVEAAEQAVAPEETAEQNPGRQEPGKDA